MANLGFVAFRIPPNIALPDSCVMAVLRSVPTLGHFDPEVASFWVNDEGCGKLESVDRETGTPLSRDFSWGRIQLLDRFGVRNSFVSFGGALDVERIGPDALLLIFRSRAPILRLRSHSQRADDGADEVMAFFGRIVPRLWASPDLERLISASAADDLYAAFLLHRKHRLGASARLRDATVGNARAFSPELDVLALHRPQAVAGGRKLLQALAFES
jgi:hypothetical protein